MKNNDEKVKEMLEKEPVPAELEPENIKVMLDNKAPAIKRKGISNTTRFAAMAAACAVMGGSMAYFSSNSNNKKLKESSVISSGMESSENALAENDSTDHTSLPDNVKRAPYMTGASSYADVYKVFKNNANNNGYGGMQKSVDGIAVESEADYADEEVMNEAAAPGAIESSAADMPRTSGSDDFSETHDQEEGVRESDIAKTDGKNIYYLNSNYSNSKLNIASVDSGMFTSHTTIDIADDVSRIYDNGTGYTYAAGMYLYNDMVVIVGTSFHYEEREYVDDIDDDDVYYEEVMPYDYYWNDENAMTFAAFYSTGDNPQLIDVYYQDGDYNDVRIAPDGCMYLVSVDSSMYYSGKLVEENYDAYIPKCGLSDSVDLIAPDCILLPEDDVDLSYTVISGIDLNESGNINIIDTKALAGYTGDIYCSQDNLYTVNGWDDTAITRFAISGGTVTPAASGTVEGRINDQFSMSEYNGYFRIATTCEKYNEVFHKYSDQPWYDENDTYLDPDDGYMSYELEKRDNRVYVLDMDLNTVGSIGDFGLNEEIKSVNFSGDIAYVVTFRQTDPLYAIDLSEPTAPTIMDEFKINGFSTYMQQWSDGLLIGFGADADEDGKVNGVKAVMFDNSDPNNLQEVGLYKINSESHDNYNKWVYSNGTYDRKALLIAPEKNIFCFPLVEDICHYTDDYYSEDYHVNSKYIVLSYEDGNFVYRGEISNDALEDYYNTKTFDRMVYIGDQIYALSAEKFVSADINTVEVIDSLDF